MNDPTSLLLPILIIVLLSSLALLWLSLRPKSQQQEARHKESDNLMRELQRQLLERLIENRHHQETKLHEFQGKLEQDFNSRDKALQKESQQFREQFDRRQMETSDKLQKTLRENIDSISAKVDQRLSDGFKKTTDTFSDVVKRLALIDEAQKRITELSTNVVSLQRILSDKRARGAFGEVQLTAMIRDMIPEHGFKLQETLSNDKRADCLLLLPPPTGNMVIDAKFPLESYQQLENDQLSKHDKKFYQQQFKQDIKKHIQDIASKYIIPGETADGAMMFIPAESIAAEIYSHYPELVAQAQKSRVWITSPTTMMAILTTAQAVLKDEATRENIHIIQKHIGELAKDFVRFEQRMSKLATHIKQAHEDAGDVNKSAKKLTSRFHKIEKVELEQQSPQLPS